MPKMLLLIVNNYAGFVIVEDPMYVGSIGDFKRWIMFNGAKAMSADPVGPFGG